MNARVNDAFHPPTSLRSIERLANYSLTMVWQDIREVNEQEREFSADVGKHNDPPNVFRYHRIVNNIDSRRLASDARWTPASVGLFSSATYCRGKIFRYSVGGV